VTGIEEHIRKAIEEGGFDDLPGKGQPLHLEENPLEDPEWRLASHVLRSSGFTLPWIEARREIQSEIEAARLTLARAWSYHKSSQSNDRHDEWMESEWQRFLQSFCEQVALLNRRIEDFNLQAPSLRFHLRKLNAEKEICSIIEENEEDQE